MDGAAGRVVGRRAANGILSRVILALLQVSEGESVDGYRNFLAVPEWWKLKTPFSQYFTKNYSGNFLPLAHVMGLSPGHVLYSVCSCVDNAFRPKIHHICQ